MTKQSNSNFTSELEVHQLGEQLWGLKLIISNKFRLHHHACLCCCYLATWFFSHFSITTPTSFLHFLNVITQSVSLSLRRNPYLHALHNLLSFAMWFQVGPTYWTKSSHHLVLGRPRGLLFPRSIHSVTNCPSIVTFLRHVTRPSVFAFSYAPDNVCRTTLFPDPVCTLSILQGDSYHDSFHLPLSCGQFLKLGVAKRPGLTAIWEYTFVKCFPL